MTDQLSQLFAGASEYSSQEKEPKRFGWRYNGRYHMPPLPGEATVKVCPPGQEPWVPFGVQSTTNLIDAFEESRGLNIWEQELALWGMALSPSLYEKLVMDVHRWQAEGVDILNLKLYPHVRKALTGGPKGGDDSYVGQAKAIAKGNEAREAGTNRHEAWEHRAKTGELIGTPAMQEQILALETLLAANDLERVPGLCERVVRNTVVQTAGRFDDILRERSTGRLLMADLKTKRKPFWSWMSTDAQLATYARSEWMLDFEQGTDGVWRYVEGPAYHVDLTEGVVLQVPSDGSPAYLRRADLEYGWRVAQHARTVCEMRSYGKSAERQRLAAWVPSKDR